MRRACSDPFERHKKVVRKNDKQILEVLRSLVNDERIQRGVFLCCSCRIKLRREPAGLPIRQDETDNVGDEPSSPATCPAMSSGSSTPSPLVRLDAASVMPLLGKSPRRISEL